MVALAIFQVLTSHMCLVATGLYSMGLKNLFDEITGEKLVFLLIVM